jgi:hypothetical protein
MSRAVYPEDAYTTDWVKAYLQTRANPAKATYEDYIKDSGDQDCKQYYFTKLRNEFCRASGFDPKTGKRTKKAKPNGKSNGKSNGAKPTTKLQALEAENTELKHQLDYLKWKAHGEKHGFIADLLGELVGSPEAN